MNIDVDTILVHLGHRELLSVEVSRALHIRCIEGTVWITHHGDTADTIVEPGKSATLTRPGVAVLQALKASKVALWVTSAAAPVLVGACSPIFDHTWKAACKVM